MKRFLIIFLAVLWVNILFLHGCILVEAADIACASEYVKVKDISIKSFVQVDDKWQVSIFQGSPDRFGNIAEPAMICFEKDSFRQCIKSITGSGDTIYNFQRLCEFAVILLSTTKQAKSLLLVTEYSHEGGSGSLKYITAWTYFAKSSKYSNILPNITITEQGEYKLLKSKEGLAKVIVVADYIWGNRETHYSPHRYNIRIFVYNDVHKTYRYYKKYVTKHKYKSLDGIDKVDVIMPELNNIKKILKKEYRMI